MFRSSLVLVLASFLSLSCSEKNGDSGSDPFDEKMDLPATKPLTPGQSADAMSMFKDVNSVTSGESQLNPDPSPMRTTDVVEDAILNNCKLIEDTAQTGNRLVVDGHTESLAGKTCPINATSHAESEYQQPNPNSLRVFGSVQKQLMITGEPLLSMVDLRSIMVRSGVALAIENSGNSSHWRAAANGAGSMNFATHGTLEFFQKVRMNQKMNDMTGAVQSGRLTVGQGVLVNNQWYIVVIKVVYTDGVETRTCTLNGIDFSQDPACTGTSLKATPAWLAHSAYGK